MSDTLTFPDFALALLEGDLDEHLDRMEDLIKQRRVLLAKDQDPSAYASKDFQPGDRVQFCGNVSPKYLLGVKGTIIEKKQSRYVMHVDDDPRARQRRGSRTVCPPEILERAS